MTRRGGIVGIGSVDREIARLALPALATLLAEPLYILTDTAIVGHLGTEQLAGLALASTVLVTGYAMFVFLAYGTTAAVSRLLGAGDERAATEDAIGSIWLAVMLSVVVVSIGAFAGHPLLAALGGTGPVLAYGWTYLSISLFGVPALLIGLAGTGYLRGLQNTRTPLVVTVAGVIVNLVIEVILIFGFDYGVGASALASVLAQWGVAVTYVSLIVTGSRSDGVALVPRLGSIRRLIMVGFELFVRTAALRGAILITTMVAAGMGTVALAAHQIVFEIWNFVATGAGLHRHRGTGDDRTTTRLG
ncbi:MAG: MATE family efflux transporter [Microthrixaceae bacterium]